MPTPNVTANGGLANTGIENSSVYIRDVDSRYFYLESFKYPLASLLFTMGTDLERAEEGKYALKGSNAPKRKATTNMKFEHTESEMLKFAFNPTAAIATGDTSISVTTTDDDYFVAGHEILLVNAAGQREVARVTAVGSGSLTVTRNIGTTGAIALATTDTFYLMGVVRAEDSTSTSPIQAKSETLFNYCEFISEPYGVTLIENAQANYHGDSYKRKKMEALARMKRQLETMMWFGVRSLDSSTTNPVWHNGGILYWLESQFTDVAIVDVGGILTKQTWDGWLLDALKHNNMKKFVFCSSVVLTAVSGFASDQLRPADVNLSKWGMTITEYQSPHGTVFLVREPLFDEVTSMNGAAVCLDMTNVDWRFLSGNGINLDLKDYEDRQENDRTGKKGEWMVVGGIDVHVGKSHAILRNVLG